MTSGYSFTIDSSRAGALNQLAEKKAGPDSKESAADQSQLAAVKKYIESRILALDDKFDGVLVIAQGEYDAATGRDTATIQMYGKQGHL